MNLREGPGLHHSVIGELAEDTRLRSEGREGAFGHVAVLDGPETGRFGYVHLCCVRPENAREHYTARLGADDHFNSQGVRLVNPAWIIRQDRANFHGLGTRDADDRTDKTFHLKEERTRLGKRLLEAPLDPETHRVIQMRAPLIAVTVFEDRVDVTVLDEGHALP